MAMPDLGSNLVAMFQRSAAAGGDQPFLWAKAQGTYRSLELARAARRPACSPAVWPARGRAPATGC